MGTEIERKFLVSGPWPGGEGHLQRQGYLAIQERGTVRVRIENGTAVLNIKSRQEGLTRAEFEYEIPLEDGEFLLAHHCGFVVEKTRYRAGRWEIDVFHGENEGLVVAEIELSSEDEEIELPDWIGEEVSHDARYRVAYLSEHPWRAWRGRDAASK